MERSCDFICFVFFSFARNAIASLVISSTEVKEIDSYKINCFVEISHTMCIDIITHFVHMASSRVNL